MTHAARLRPLGLAAALLLVGACGIPRLRQIPGTDRATRSRGRPAVSVGRNGTNGCNGRVAPPSGAGVTIGDRGSVCAEVTSDTLPDPNTDHTQPPRKVP